MLASNGGLLVVVHTLDGGGRRECDVRIVSARKANAAEKAVYEEFL